jgi:hypothetical protein
VVFGDHETTFTISKAEKETTWIRIQVSGLGGAYNIHQFFEHNWWKKKANLETIKKDE